MRDRVNRDIRGPKPSIVGKSILWIENTTLRLIPHLRQKGVGPSFLNSPKSNHASKK